MSQSFDLTPFFYKNYRARASIPILIFMEYYQSVLLHKVLPYKDTDCTRKIFGKITTNSRPRRSLESAREERLMSIAPLWLNLRRLYSPLLSLSACISSTFCLILVAHPSLPLLSLPFFSFPTYLSSRRDSLLVWRVRVIAKYNIPLAGQQAWLAGSSDLTCEYSLRSGGARPPRVHVYRPHRPYTHTRVRTLGL